MFVRIVKMSFNPLKVDEFLANFEAKKRLIREFEGCEFLELYRDKHHANVFFTYSYWAVSYTHLTLPTSDLV